MKESTKSTIKTYVIAILIPLGVGLLSALLTMGNMNIYDEIVKPPLAPPGILFPIVWTILYVLMGVSSALVFQKREFDVKNADTGIYLYAISLTFNFFWSIFFFNLQWYLFSFIWLVSLFALIIGTIIYYHKVSPLGAYLQIPYAVWVAFAGYLNFAIYLLNM